MGGGLNLDEVWVGDFKIPITCSNSILEGRGSSKGVELAGEVGPPFPCESIKILDDNGGGINVTN